MNAYCKSEYLCDPTYCRPSRLFSVVQLVGSDLLKQNFLFIKFYYFNSISNGKLARGSHKFQYFHWNGFSFWTDTHYFYINNMCGFPIQSSSKILCKRHKKHTKHYHCRRNWVFSSLRVEENMLFVKFTPTKFILFSFKHHIKLHSFSNNVSFHSLEIKYYISDTMIEGIGWLGNG